jgi:arylsulfatase
MNSEKDPAKTEVKNSTLNRRSILLGGSTLAVASAIGTNQPIKMAQAQAQQPAPGRKPNILVIFGDDIGMWNISAYNRGMMGYRTPNIDRIAKEGAIFTDLYAQQSCTAGRAAFITGQSCFRTGLLKVGLPGAKEGLSAKDPTLAELLKPQGYATGQFGKNHLGDRNEFLPTVHGFDEFFGNLYHLNAEEEPENPDYPKNPEFRARFGPRGVLKCVATDTDDPTEDPRFGRVGKQKIVDTGPLNTKRMETVDEEFLGDAMGSSTAMRRPTNHFSAGSMRPACTSSPISNRHRKARPVWGLPPTAWSSTTAWSVSSSSSSTTSASPTTPSSCTPPTTALKSSHGPTAAPRRSGARRTKTGKVATASLA